ncbi:shikimate kinase, chloroplastic-like [Abrus precatorius]|uniref:shikimate kinase n=1 Tax=Abrus precatorius TaxID=3816 RepID=A0A8B8LGY1_ABRPR|nr:shikimate kinase, chloroplastic-like [Abrus precatorius]XP_027355356.1 shikimate kinase, chloroplastic-like [Abrus precatorius]XP_027355365.1 shikimate kinase, chloroplastic-like [Abrus precatorius]XP_027355372.1 shikimate kinase, chloroplastic-like [Abrus precatorius]XP_027355380.1 shikimate kinase, chloroplastic-like [Abrus precatorius]
MEAKVVQGLQLSTMAYCDKLGKTRPRGSLRISGELKDPKKLQVFVSAKLQPARPSMRKPRRRVPLEVACSYKDVSASTLESGSLHAVIDEELILKSKSQEIEPLLNGHCIYLVGMMGSGKTTVGKILSQVLSYSFFDSDALVEEEVDGTSVADIFKHHGEDFFRDKETEVLRKLSMMHRHVISTGGGAVLRPINWKYMHQGISVWLDVPVEALAQRITAVGTNSRPLLHYEAGDAFTRTFMRLSALFEERSESYANANARVSLENMAAKRGQKDVLGLSPAAIAIEALEQIKGFLKGQNGC